MPWARIDDGFDDHPKVLALLEHDDGAAAIGLWTLCLTWAHRNTRKKGKTPGRLPGSLPRRYLGVLGRDAAKLLVEADLWEPRDDGWQIHDFDQYLPTEKTSDARAAAGKKGAAARWGNRGKGAGRDGNLPGTDSKLPSASMANDGNAMAGHGTDEANRPPDGTLAGDALPIEVPDGKEPSPDSKLPSGLLQDDGKPVASDDSRAHARRAISNEIAPTPGPDPELPDASADGGVRGGATSDSPSKRRRGTRLPENFTVTREMVAWARDRCPHADGRLETEKFVNHWTSKAGKEAVKLDWVKTWKNWMLEAEQRASRSLGAIPGKPGTPLVDPRDEWKHNRS